MPKSPESGPSEDEPKQEENEANEKSETIDLSLSMEESELLFKILAREKDRIEKEIPQMNSRHVRTNKEIMEKNLTLVDSLIKRTKKPEIIETEK